MPWSVLEQSLCSGQKVKIFLALQVFAFGTTPHLADLAGAACIMAAVFAMFAEDAVMAKVPWRFL